MITKIIKFIMRIKSWSFELLLQNAVLVPEFGYLAVLTVQTPNNGWGIRRAKHRMVLPMCILTSEPEAKIRLAATVPRCPAESRAYYRKLAEVLIQIKLLSENKLVPCENYNIRFQEKNIWIMVARIQFGAISSLRISGFYHRYYIARLRWVHHT